MALLRNEVRLWLRTAIATDDNHSPLLPSSETTPTSSLRLRDWQQPRRRISATPQSSRLSPEPWCHRLLRVLIRLAFPTVMRCGPVRSVVKWWRKSVATGTSKKCMAPIEKSYNVLFATGWFILIQSFQKASLIFVSNSFNGAKLTG